jgi:transcriptional regulator with XRE-family HTH domain
LQSSFIHSSKVIIGKKIKFFREKNNLTQQELADLIGGERQYVSKLEKGKKNMTLDNLDRIIIALKCTQEDFLNIKPNP